MTGTFSDSRRRFTPIHATPLGTRYVVLAEIDPELRASCVEFAAKRRALLLLEDGTDCVFYEEWQLWIDSLDAGVGAGE